MSNENTTTNEQPAGAAVRSSDGLAVTCGKCGNKHLTIGERCLACDEPMVSDIEATWAELWKHLGEPDYSPSAIDLAKHCFMVGVDWGIKRAANHE